MGFRADTARLVLVAVNIVFLLLGLVVTVLGLVLRYGESLYEPYLDVGIEKLQTCLQDTNLNTFDVGSIEMKGILSSLALGLIIGGLFLSTVAFLGCCGACCRAKKLMWMYASLVLILVVAEGITVGILYGKPEVVKDKLKVQLKDYAGLWSSDAFTVVWNIVMIQFKCCGVDSYGDFDSSSSSKWNALSVGLASYTLTTPIVCCKTLPTTPVLDNCAISPFTGSSSNYDMGCYDTIWGYSFGNTSIAVPVVILCAIIQIAFFISAIVVATSGNIRDKVMPFNK